MTFFMMKKLIKINTYLQKNVLIKMEANNDDFKESIKKISRCFIKMFL